MNWMLLLAQVGYGFMQGVANSQPTRARALSYDDEDDDERGYDFRGHMRHLARKFDLEITKLTNDIAWFNANAKRATYRIMARETDGNICVMVVSNVAFEAGCLPRKVCKMLKEVNSELRYSHFSWIDGDDFASFYIAATGPATALTDEAFHRIGEEMIPRMVTLDLWLAKNGYAD